MILLLAGFDKSGKRVGFYPSSALMYAGLAGLLTANTTMEFFFWWELMTLGSYFLILRGKKSMAHALSYMTFSLGGAYSMLAGFGLISAANNGNLELATLSTAGAYQSVIFILLVIGFLTNTAAAPLHIWLPGAHSEAESDVSPVVSAVLLKAGVFGLIVTMLAMGPQNFKGIDIYYVLGWLGVITALLGNMMAAFEEDAKRLLAYSSVGQLGGVLFALSMMNHLGWLTATAFALNHFVFKALLFLAIGGVVMRVKTRNMYEMGGLITRMPISFLSVMIGIIALSGVPPLTGFGGKWLSYNAMIDSQMYFQGAVASFAGLVAFLYCFRLIFAIFLGQLKDNHRHVKEAPFWMLVPQFTLLGLVMFFSVVPGVALNRSESSLLNIFRKIRSYGTDTLLKVISVTGMEK
jgi:formate hydrogenlyase subunit 3/multisubunit Na+/H+ antiporter MnhD subunit